MRPPTPPTSGLAARKSHGGPQAVFQHFRIVVQQQQKLAGGRRGGLIDAARKAVVVAIADHFRAANAIQQRSGFITAGVVHQNNLRAYFLQTRLHRPQTGKRQFRPVVQDQKNTQTHIIRAWKFKKTIRLQKVVQARFGLPRCRRLHIRLGMRHEQRT